MGGDESESCYDSIEEQMDAPDSIVKVFSSPRMTPYLDHFHVVKNFGPLLSNSSLLEAQGSETSRLWTHAKKQRLVRELLFHKNLKEINKTFLSDHFKFTCVNLL